MADTKVTGLTENTAPLGTDLLYIIDDPGGSAASQKITIANLIKAINLDGWVAAGETWTYAAADDPTFTFTISGVDLTTKYYAGMRLKLTQTTIKYFIITKVAFSTDTTVTVYGGTDYDLADAAITLPYYSTAKAPAGFPLDPTKWTIEVTDTSSRTQNAPAQNTWYNLGSITISIPIGCWMTNYVVFAGTSDASSSSWSIYATLSTANNSESDVDLSSGASAGNLVNRYSILSRSKYLNLTAKTAYYLNTRTTVANLDDMYNRNDLSKLIIRAICAYL